MMPTRTLVQAFLFDVVLLAIFATLGRNSHTLGLTLGGIAETAWPFVVGLSVSWVLALAWRAPLAPIRTGLPLWVGTVVIGMLLRALTGAGTALPFVLIATGTIGLMLVGWRSLTELIRRGRSSHKR